MSSKPIFQTSGSSGSVRFRTVSKSSGSGSNGSVSKSGSDGSGSAGSKKIGPPLNSPKNAESKIEKMEIPQICPSCRSRREISNGGIESSVRPNLTPFRSVTNFGFWFHRFRFLPVPVPTVPVGGPVPRFQPGTVRLTVTRFGS